MCNIGLIRVIISQPIPHLVPVSAELLFIMTADHVQAGQIFNIAG